MNIVKSFLIGLVMLSFAYSANVTISGTVTDTAGVPISGASVKLLVGGQYTTTGLDGSFTLLGNNVSITKKPAQIQSYDPVISLTAGMLKLHIQEQSLVSIRTYNLKGCLIASMHNELSAGDHSIALANKSLGVYLYKVHINNKDYQIISNSLCSYVVQANAQQEASISSLQKRAKSLVAINDTIRVRKDGYSDCMVSVHTSDTSGITIKMHWTLTVTDVDGNVYHTVKIGNQVWTVENLKTMHNNDGTAIALVADSATWVNVATPGYCWYHNDSSTYKKANGALYNWDAVNTGKLAPTGWHVPTNAEWDTLDSYLITHGYNYDGTTRRDKVAKAMASKTGWQASSDTGTIGCNSSTNNSSGFSALPSGYRDDEAGFGSMDMGCNWWSTTAVNISEAYFRNLNYNYSSLSGGSCFKGFGFSVRLVKNN